MKRISRILALSSFAGFFVLTLWRGIVHGIIEEPSFDVSHLEAGAGDTGLIVQFFIAILAFGFAALWFFSEPRGAWKMAAILMALVTPILFLFCSRGLQRFAPRYSEAGFQRLIVAQHSGKNLYTNDVVAALGEPLMRRKDTSGGETWLYSYMPSCGFGWDKKYVSIDTAGQITEIFTAIEP
jgi:hypothetical protein